MFEPL
jgi:senataxin